MCRVVEQVRPQNQSFEVPRRIEMDATRTNRRVQSVGVIISLLGV